MSKAYKLYLEYIERSIKKIDDLTRGISYEEFSKNEMVCDAVLRNLEIIGEAVKNLPAALKMKHPEVEWKKLRV